MVEQARREKQSALAARELNPDQPIKDSNNILDQVKLGIDFTKLAKLAQHQNKKQISNYLIGYEKQIVKKIPFYL